MVGAVRGNLDHLSAQPANQRGIFAHRINNDNPILGNGQKDIEQFPLCRKGFSRARRAEVHSVGRLQLFAVSHNDIVGKGVHAIVEGLPVHPQLPCHKGDKNCRGAGCHTTLDLHFVVAEGQRGHKALLLLPVQPLEGAVVFLCDAAHGKHIVFQPLEGRGHIDYRKSQKEHPLVTGLEVSKKLRRILGKGNEVGRENVGIVPGPDSLPLFLHLHFSDVGDFSLDGFDSL